MFTRRHLVAASVALAAAGAVGAGTTAWRWWDRPPGEGLKRLAPDEHAFAQALAEAWMPHGGEPRLSGAEARLGDFLDDVLEGMEPPTARQLKLLLQALDATTLPTQLASYRKLPLAARTDVLHGWLHSDILLLRAGVSALLVLLAAGWTTHPEVLPVLQPSFRCAYGR